MMKDQELPQRANTKKSQTEADRLRAPTVDASGRRRWLYPDRRPGPKANFRKKLALVLILFYLIAPYVKVNGLPLIRLDVLAQKAYFFGAAFSFHEANYLVFIFLGLALALFLVTSLFGRVWCGYACPQTVFVEWLIRPVEEFFEGNAFRRRKLDQEPFSWPKFARKTGKYISFVLIVLVISNAFLAFFVPPEVLLQWISQSPAKQPFAFGVMVFISGALFLDLVWFREQFCSFLCPYARFQAIMFDPATPTVSYDKSRGEPRGKGAKAGDCIDCGFCVRVCPTGIDIRDGLQLECIQCARCVDACDQIMSNLKRPKGLIRVASQLELDGNGKAAKGFRLRPTIYGLALALVLGLFISTVWLRSPLDFVVIRQPGTTYVTMPDGRIANYFRVRVDNRLNETQEVQIAAQDGASLICNICGQSLAAYAEETGSLVVIVEADWESSEVELQLADDKKLKLPLILPGRAR